MEKLNSMWTNVNVKHLLESKRFGVFLIAILVMAYRGGITSEDVNNTIDLAKILIGSYAAEDAVSALGWGKSSGTGDNG